MTRLRRASAVLLTRGAGPDREVFLVERSPALRFLGGYWALPGGTLDGESEGFVAAARRELEEETAVRVGELSRLCLMTTPDFVPVRYETWFFHGVLPADQEPRVVPGELVQGRFVAPRQALAAWRKGELRIAPPILWLLELLDRLPWEQFLAAAAQQAQQFEAGQLHPVRFSPGLFVAPLKTPTLPPATTTNCVIAGLRSLYLIDPATYEERERQRLWQQVDAMCAQGARVVGVVATHHHPDHVGSLAAASQRYQVPVFGHPLTLPRLPAGNFAQEPIEDGGTLPLGEAPDGATGWHLRAVHTPGHDRGHLCFLESRYHAAVVGDMVSTLSTILIEPPEGHLATYLRSLQRLLQEPMTTLYPAHGPAAPDGHRLLRGYLAHRKEREEALVAGLAAGLTRIEELVPHVYADTDPGLHGIARQSLWAGLLKLEEEGRARRDGERWKLLR